ncbi:hypothetical protein CT113_03780 [Levilactobacillus brevis]|uniref:hypothetical protein n=1 Tax=Levilactobacillus brevis TaxID=1580 RepID=UPI0003FB2006|nr:hypothetical protein [Levilactobacillus brevis]ATU69505.1 hypothetical protein CT113_03780 [Levilactobacillus brevis]KID42952.1 hypothetical protein LbDm2_2184 [Levilactobacillus brevis]
MKYTVELQFKRFNLSTLREETLTMSLKEQSVGFRRMMETYFVTDDGWDQDNGYEITINDRKHQTNGKWWLDSVLRIPEVDK